MFEVKGKYGSATVYTDNADSETQRQIIELLNQEFTSGAHLRIMPDCHAGAGCVIGTTMQITDKVVPNLVGVDIGCGMDVAYLGDLGGMSQDEIGKMIDGIIARRIPSGFNKRNEVSQFIDNVPMKELACADAMDYTVINHSLGTLGGGNHFIEINKSNIGYYLVIHSGSRNPGLTIANYYQKIATDTLNGTGTPKDLCYLEGDAMQAYLHDMEIAQLYAAWNRMAMVYDIMDELDMPCAIQFSTVHNFIEHNSQHGWILRKGAAPAYEGEQLIIPMNMRDGSLICKGKGNAEWNYSAPHGAGRILSRGQAKRTISLQDFQATMQGVYSTSISTATLDESPMAYKPMEEIVANIGDTVDVVETIKPIYNFKAG